MEAYGAAALRFGIFQRLDDAAGLRDLLFARGKPFVQKGYDGGMDATRAVEAMAVGLGNQLRDAVRIGVVGDGAEEAQGEATGRLGCHVDELFRQAQRFGDGFGLERGREVLAAGHGGNHTGMSGDDFASVHDGTGILDDEQKLNHVDRLELAFGILDGFRDQRYVSCALGLGKENAVHAGGNGGFDIRHAPSYRAIDANENVAAGAAARWYGDQLNSRTGIDVIVEGEDIDPRLPPSVETSLFRIIQEALTNVVKHAQVSCVIVEIEPTDEALRVTVADEGTGFDSSQPSGHQERLGWGLMTMAERAEAMGARFNVNSRPGHGTQITVEVDR